VFAFNVHPAYVTLGDGIQVAWDYLVASWRRWLPVVAAVGVVSLIAALLTSSIVPADSTTWFTEDPVTGRLVAGPEFGNALGRVFAIWGLQFLVTFVAGWFVAAIAIAGLRGRPLEVGWIIGRGVLAFLASILAGLAVVGVMIAWFVALVISAVFPPLLLVTFPSGVVLVVWVVVRLIFTTLAVFDGRGVFDALSESWNLSSRSVLRLLGWGIVAGLLVFAFGILAGLFTTVFSSGAAASVASGLSSAVSQVGACFTMFMLAVLYESQRLRRDIMAGIEPMPAGPYGAGGAAADTYAGGIPDWNAGGPVHPGTGYAPVQYPPTTYPPALFPTDGHKGWGSTGYQAANPGATRQGYPPYPAAPADPMAETDPPTADPVPPGAWRWPEPPGATGDDTPKGTQGTTNR
jgi:hypothetical protein